MTVKQIMSTKVFTVRPDKKLFVVGEVMEWAHVRHVPVVDVQGRLVGIVSHRDLLRASISSVETHIVQAERRQHLAQITGGAGHASARAHGDARNYRPAGRGSDAHPPCGGRLPVIDQGVLVGIVTAHDMLGLIVHSPSLSEPKISSAA